MTTNISKTNRFPSALAVGCKDEKFLESQNRFFTQENCTPPMFETSVTPPPHVWEKIARALDKQDNLKNAHYFKSNVGTTTSNKIRKKIYFTAVAITAFSCLLLLGK